MIIAKKISHYFAFFGLALCCSCQISVSMRAPSEPTHVESTRTEPTHVESSTPTLPSHDPSARPAPVTRMLDGQGLGQDAGAVEQLARAEFRDAVHDILIEGVRRLVDYQSPGVSGGSRICL